MKEKGIRDKEMEEAHSLRPALIIYTYSRFLQSLMLLLSDRKGIQSLRTAAAIILKR